MSDNSADIEKRWEAASSAYESGNFELAIRAFTELYDEGIECCATEIGLVYESMGNSQAAIEWYQKGTYALDAESFIGLANLYVRGKGVDPSLEYAKEILSVCVRTCKDKVEHRVELLLGDIYSLENDEQRAKDCYNRSYSLGNLIALKRLVCMDKKNGNYLKFFLRKISLFFKVYSLLRRDLRDMRIREF